MQHFFFRQISLKRNSSRQSEKDLSKYNAWQQLKIFQQQRNLNSTEEEVIKDTSDDFESKTYLRMSRPKLQMKQTNDISDDCNSLILPMQPSDTDELHSGREGSVIQLKAEVFPSVHSGRANGEATKYEKDRLDSLAPVNSNRKGSTIQPKAEVFPSVRSGRAIGGATEYEKHGGSPLTLLQSGRNGLINHEKPFEYDMEEIPMPPPLVTVSYFGDKNEITRRRLISEKNSGKPLANKTKLKKISKYLAKNLKLKKF